MMDTRRDSLASRAAQWVLRLLGIILSLAWFVFVPPVVDVVFGLLLLLVLPIWMIVDAVVQHHKEQKEWNEG